LHLPVSISSVADIKGGSIAYLFKAMIYFIPYKEVRMKKKSILLDLLLFSQEELECVFMLGMEAMYADNRIRIEEKGILSLIRSLLDVAGEAADGPAKAEWEVKIRRAGEIIGTNRARSRDDLTDERIKASFSDRKKQRLVLVLLLKIISADRNVDKREVDFIVARLATLWGYSPYQLVSLVESKEGEFTLPQDILYMIKTNYIYRENG
jgi:hypothetical protein